MPRSAWVLAALGGTAVVVAGQHRPDTDPVLDDDEINNINSQELGWTAGRTARFENVTWGTYRRMLGVKIPAQAVNCPPPSKIPDGQAVPESFDARTKWPDYVHAVRDQGGCGSCWAFAASETLSDRLAIASNGQQNLVLSPQALLQCDTTDQGCSGGWPTDAADFLLHTGIPADSCLPYTEGPGKLSAVNESDARCPLDCVDWSYPSLYKYKSWSYATGEDALKSALQTGPVAVSMAVYSGFQGCPIFGEPLVEPHTTPAPPPPSSWHYGQPPSCRADEELLEKNGLKVCAPACGADGSCASDVPPGTRAKPQCGLQSKTGKKLCGLHCHGGCPRNAQCVSDSVFPFAGGFCYYSPPEDTELII